MSIGTARPSSRSWGEVVEVNLLYAVFAFVSGSFVAAAASSACCSRSLASHSSLRALSRISMDLRRRCLEVSLQKANA